MGVLLEKLVRALNQITYIGLGAVLIRQHQVMTTNACWAFQPRLVKYATQNHKKAIAYRLYDGIVKIGTACSSTQVADKKRKLTPRLDEVILI